MVDTFNNFQRVGSISNSHVGRDFADKAKAYFESKNIFLNSAFLIDLGVPGREKKPRAFLGTEERQIIVDCKSHTWTKPDYKVPSAKITTWNQTMYHFYLAPPHYRKVLFCLKDYNPKLNVTLAEYYLKHNIHLIPKGVEFMEYCEETKTVTSLIAP